jgi:hypothetical protein
MNGNVTDEMQKSCKEAIVGYLVTISEFSLKWEKPTKNTEDPLDMWTEQTFTAGPTRPA